jgi:hypothetical protein
MIGTYAMSYQTIPNYPYYLGIMMLLGDNPQYKADGFIRVLDDDRRKNANDNIASSDAAPKGH